MASRAVKRHKSSFTKQVRLRRKEMGISMMSGDTAAAYSDTSSVDESSASSASSPGSDDEASIIGSMVGHEMQPAKSSRHHVRSSYSEHIPNGSTEQKQDLHHPKARNSSLKRVGIKEAGDNVDRGSKGEDGLMIGRPRSIHVGEESLLIWTPSASKPSRRFHSIGVSSRISEVSNSTASRYIQTEDPVPLTPRMNDATQYDENDVIESLLGKKIDAQTSTGDNHNSRDDINYVIHERPKVRPQIEMKIQTADETTEAVSVLVDAATEIDDDAGLSPVLIDAYTQPDNYLGNTLHPMMANGGFRSTSGATTPEIDYTTDSSSSSEAPPRPPRLPPPRIPDRDYGTATNSQEGDFTLPTSSTNPRQALSVISANEYVSRIRVGFAEDADNGKTDLPVKMKHAKGPEKSGRYNTFSGRQGSRESATILNPLAENTLEHTTDVPAKVVEPADTNNHPSRPHNYTKGTVTLVRFAPG